MRRRKKMTHSSNLINTGDLESVAPELKKFHSPFVQTILHIALCARSPTG